MKRHSLGRSVLYGKMEKTRYIQECRRPDEADGSTEKTEQANMAEEEKRRFVSLIKPYLWWGE